MMCIQNLVLFCQFVLKILSKNQFLTSVKGRNSVANLRKTISYNTNIDLVNDIVYTEFGLNLSIRSQDIEQKPNSDVNLRKTIIYDTNINFVNDNVYTKFNLNRSIRFQDIEQKLNSDVNEGRNSVANLPKFELIHAFMYVPFTHKNEEDPIKNEGARVFTRFLPL